jgi:two-component system OmpR family response regulator/two-component system response regulator QseB
MRILLVEDDTMLGADMKRALEQAGYAVDWAQAGDEAVAALTAHDYAAALLDLSLPELDGIDALKAVRGHRNRTPIIIVTARDGSKQRVEGLDAGADDYVTKPFDLDELLARIRSTIRRGEGRANDVLAAQSVRYDLTNRTVTKDDAPISLTAKELKVLAKLMNNAGRFVSKSDLENALYTGEDDVESNTIEVTIYALRRKLGARFIVTARGLGYMIAK